MISPSKMLVQQNSQEFNVFHFNDVFLTNLNYSVKWDRVCIGMKNYVLSFAYIQGKLICIKSSLHIHISAHCLRFW